MKASAKEIRKNLRELSDSAIAEQAQRFFKTGKGEYGEGDKFLGIRVPIIRKLVGKYLGVSIDEVLLLLRSSFHEERLFALLMLVQMFSRGSDKEKKEIYELYLSNTKYINNWDLVDSSASYIVGEYLEDRDKQPIYDMARSEDLWERRISIISTFHMIKCNDLNDALEISEILKNDREDLIHKAVGWMLREIGKRNLSVEKAFLKKHYKEMPRTMLRYAIEKFPEKERKMYLKGLA
jgi:3-methyladenine DNA glycosylase AlkD